MFGGCASEKREIRGYPSDVLAAVVFSHPRLRPISLNEDIVANKTTLSVQRETKLMETEEKRQAGED